jgi:hypothetical protein
MFRITLAKALLGAGAMGVVGGATAFAASPPANQTAPQAKPDRAHRGSGFGGTVKSVSATQLVVEKAERKKKDGTTVPASTKTFVLNGDTKIVSGLDRKSTTPVALKVGDRVRVRYTTAGGVDTAKMVVVVPDHRSGVLKSVAADGKSFVLTTKSGDVTITVDTATKYFTGHRKSGAAGSLTGMKVGDRVMVTGDATGSAFKAAIVAYGTPGSKDHHRAPGNGAAPKTNA